MKESKEHKELLSLWGIKNNVTQGQIRDLTGSWHCARCTYLNDSYTHEYTCKICAIVDMARYIEAKKQVLRQENLANEVTKSLNQQNDLLNDLDDDSEDDDVDDGDSANLNSFSRPVETPDFRYIAPKEIGKQLHLLLLPDLLLDCLLFLGSPTDVISVLLVNKYFSWLADSDAIWWSFQSRFINDPSSTSTESRKELFTSSSSSSSSAPRRYPASAGDATQVETWVCTQCQLTQALASSTHCEMCLAERPLSSSLPSTPVAQAAFVIIRSAEHLAALWTEGNRSIRDKDSNRKCSSYEDGVTAKNREGDGLSRVEDPLTAWAWFVGLPGAPFTIDRALAAHTVRPHTMHKQAGKWFYRCKIACLERKSRQMWQSIHRGWEWIRNDLRCRIRQKWLQVYVNSDNEHDVYGCKSFKPSALSSIAQCQSKRPRIGEASESNTSSNTYKACQTSEESEAHVRAIRNEAEEVKENLRSSETLRRALRKLTTLNWVLCYESIKAELSLQAEAIALELKALWVMLSNASRSDAPQHASASGTGTTMHTGSHGELPLELCQLFLEKLNRACVVFISCADQLEENCCSLNDEIAKDKDIYRDSTGYSTKNLDENTGLPCSQGTPSISDMALIALRNHGMLSHWTADSVLHCMSVVGGHAEGESHSVSNLSYSSSFTSYASVSSKSSLHDGGLRKRKIEESDSLSVKTSDDDNLSESVIALRRKSVKLLLQLYDLCEVLDVEDDLLSVEKSTQAVFKRRYIHFLCSLPCLASSIRLRNNSLNVQASKNRSNQWDGDDIHFSYTRQRGCAREGPFDPRRDKKIDFADHIQEDQRTGFEDSSDFEITTHVLKVSAISSSETFHADFDPKAIRRRQLIEQYQ